MNRDEFGKNLAAGTYDLIVLDVLGDGANYGYGIVKRVFERSGQTLRWHQGTLYPVLHHLEEQCLVNSFWKGPRDGRRRRYYRLTARGRRLRREHRAQWRAFSLAVNALLGF